MSKMGLSQTLHVRIFILKLYSTYKSIEKKLRKSKIYTDWSARNKSPFCLKCNSELDLEVHHTTHLLNTIRGVMLLHDQDRKLSYRHLLDIHSQDGIDSITLCHDCHNRIHGKIDPRSKSIAELKSNGKRLRRELWSVLPRKLGFKFSQGTKVSNENHMGLVSFQCLIGFGWLIINNGVQGRVVGFNRRRFARLIGKTAGTSFNKSLSRALEKLKSNDIVVDFSIVGNEVEVHFSKQYLESIAENPWFLPLKDAYTSKMLVLSLRWLFSVQGKRREVIFSRSDLVKVLNITTPSVKWVDKAMLSALESIPDVKMKIKNSEYIFRIKNKGAVPIYTLRSLLADSMLQ